MPVFLNNFKFYRAYINKYFYRFSNVKVFLDKTVDEAKDENGNIAFSDDGAQILIQDGMVDECNQALVDLQSLEIEIDNCNLTIDDLGDEVECTPDELEVIMPFFV